MPVLFTNKQFLHQLMFKIRKKDLYILQFDCNNLNKQRRIMDKFTLQI